MPYRGRPSPACKNCRARRIKCDQARPSCGQCNRGSRQCEGYDGVGEILIHDESLSTARKFASRQNPGIANISTRLNASENDPSCPRSDCGPTTDSRTTASMHSLSQPISEVAVTFLLSKYLHGSHFLYLPSLYATASVDGPLSNIVKAVALTTLARDTAEKSVMTSAYRHYHKGLTQLNLALSATVTAATDEILASILLLTLFEHLANETRHEITEAWSKHVFGALCIVKLRGLKCLDQRESRALFKQACDNVMIYCIQNYKQYPPALVELEREVRRLTSPEEVWDIQSPDLYLRPLTTAFCDYRALRTNNERPDPTQMIAMAQDIDNNIVAFCHTLPLPWRYSTLADRHQESAQSSHQRATSIVQTHVYESHYVAQMWNTARMMRLRLHTMIQESAAERLAYNTSIGADVAEARAILASSQDTIEQQAREICASASLFLYSDNQSHAASIAAAYFLVWPLWAAARIVPDICQEFVIDRLEWMGRTLHIRSATMAAQSLKMNDEGQEWVHVCYTF